jgi:hypothetical protein
MSKIKKLEEELELVKKAGASADEIKFLQDEIDELKAKGEPKGKKPSSKSKGKPSQKKVKVKKNPKTIEWKGKTYDENDSNFCDILLEQLEERRRKRKKLGGKSKSRSISAKIGSDLADAVVKAVSHSYKENKSDILGNKKDADKFLKTIQCIEDATDRYVNEMKSILESDFSQRQFDMELKEISDKVADIKKAIKSSLK